MREKRRSKYMKSFYGKREYFNRRWPLHLDRIEEEVGQLWIDQGIHRAQERLEQEFANLEDRWDPRTGQPYIEWNAMVLRAKVELQMQIWDLETQPLLSRACHRMKNMPFAQVYKMLRDEALAAMADGSSHNQLETDQLLENLTQRMWATFSTRLVNRAARRLHDISDESGFLYLERELDTLAEQADGRLRELVLADRDFLMHMLNQRFTGTRIHPLHRLQLLDSRPNRKGSRNRAA